MKRLIDRRLPSGRIPFEQISDVAIRTVLMRINDNMSSLKKDVSDLQKAVSELQRRS